MFSVVNLSIYTNIMCNLFKESRKIFYFLWICCILNVACKNVKIAWNSRFFFGGCFWRLSWASFADLWQLEVFLTRFSSRLSVSLSVPCGFNVHCGKTTLCTLIISIYSTSLSWSSLLSSLLLQTYWGLNESGFVWLSQQLGQYSNYFCSLSQAAADLEQSIKR